MNFRYLSLVLLGSGLATALSACGPSGLVANEVGSGAPTFNPGSGGPLSSNGNPTVERGLPTEAADAPTTVVATPAATPEVAATPAAVASAAPTPKCVMTTKDSQITQVCEIVEQERAKQGLLSLQIDKGLSAVAQAFAQDMADKGYFSHTSPTGQTMEDRFKAGGLSFGWAGENIAEGQKNAVEVMKGWMNSPGHRENILNVHYKKIGVGHVGKLWVQEFSD